MKAIIAILFVLSSIATAGKEAENLLQAKVSFQGEQMTVSDVFDHLSSTLKTPPNIVYKGEAGHHVISSLNVKEVTMGNLFLVLESVADINIQIVDRYSVQGANLGGDPDPFSDGPAPNNRLTSSGIVVISSSKPVPQRPVPVEGLPGVLPSKRDLPTEVIQMKDLKLPVESLIEVITTTWRGIDADLVGQGNIAYHEPTKLLIITAPKNGVEIAQKIIGALMPEYQKQLDGRPANSGFSPLLKGQSPKNVPIDRIPRVAPGTNPGRSTVVPAVPDVRLPNPSDLNYPRVIPLPAAPGDSSPRRAPAKPVQPKVAKPASDPFGS